MTFIFDMPDNSIFNLIGDVKKLNPVIRIYYFLFETKLDLSEYEN